MSSILQDQAWARSDFFFEYGIFSGILLYSSALSHKVCMRAVSGRTSMPFYEFPFPENKSLLFRLASTVCTCCRYFVTGDSW